MAVSIPGSSLRVDPEHAIASSDQSFDPQTPVGFDPDHYIGGLHTKPSQQLMELSYPVEPIGQPHRGELAAVVSHHMHIMMGLGPIIANKHFHQVPLRVDQPIASSRVAQRDLMDQCSKHDTP